ncbi:MAG: hypothetical protein P8Y74_09215 [Desulfobacterales bacterium]
MAQDFRQHQLVIEIDTAEYNSGLRPELLELKLTVGNRGFNSASSIEVFSLTDGDNGNAEKSSIDSSVMVITPGKFSNRFVGYLKRRKGIYRLVSRGVTGYQEMTWTT